MDGFERVLRRRVRAVGDVDAALARCRDTLETSVLWTAVKEQLGQAPRAVCLALGLPTMDSALLYQLALFQLIVETCGATVVYVYDPVFEPEDVALFGRLGYTVLPEPTGAMIHSDLCSSDTTLWFLPHAELTLTEELLAASPKLLLANDLSVHGGKYTERELYDKYPYVGLALHRCIASGKPSAALQDPQSPQDPVVLADTFQKVSRRRRHRKQLPAPIDYDYSRVHYTACVRTVLPCSGPWGNAFSDLAFHRFS